MQAEQLFKLTASDPPPSGGSFGNAVAMSGNRGIVGDWSHFPTPVGAAYLFDVATGQELKILKASDASYDATFGVSVAMSGNTAIVGAHIDRSAYLFDAIAGQQLFKLVPSDANRDQFFGVSVAVDGDVVIVGAYGRSSSDSGAAYVFDATTGQELRKLAGPNTSSQLYFGGSVAIIG